jgi:hypothetical protein
MADKKDAPNVQLAAGARPLGKGPVTVGDTIICELPSPEEQAAGFNCQAAEQLVALYPTRFKFIVKKGGK